MATPDRSRLIEQYLEDGLYPVEAPAELVSPWRRTLSRQAVEVLANKSKSLSLRTIAKKQGVSHETVRRALLLGKHLHPRAVLPS